MLLWITNLPCPNGAIAQSPQAQLKEEENDFHLRLKAERQVLLRDEFVEFLRKATQKMANHAYSVQLLL